jgi:hypothetical protein
MTGDDAALEDISHLSVVVTGCSKSGTDNQSITTKTMLPDSLRRRPATAYHDSAQNAKGDDDDP